MKQLLDLPDELLVSILRNFRGSVTLNEAWQSLRTCRKVYSLGQSIVIEHIRLSNDTFMPFIWTIKAASKAFTSTIILTIEIDMDWPQIDLSPRMRTFLLSFTNEAWGVNGYSQGPRSERCLECFLAHGPVDESQAVQNLKALAKALPLLPNLNSFALLVDAEPFEKPWCRCVKSLIPDRTIASIITELPSKCTNIYIDTGGADQGYDVGAVVNAVKAKMFTVQNLWLRLCCDVSEIFESREKLESWQLQEIENVAFQAWLADFVNIPDPDDYQREGYDLWNLPDEYRLCFEKWKTVTATDKAFGTSFLKRATIY